MNNQEIAVKNMMLGAEFDKYIVEHQNFAQKIPPDSTIVFLPENDKKLYNANLKLAKQQIKSGEKVIFVRITKLSPLPKSRIVKPKLETVAPLSF